MNYEKAYKEALERAKNLHKDAIDMGENIRAKQCEIIFPELKESEDEKIRKYLLKLADRCPEDSIDFMRGVKKGDIIAWLEKQGEPIDDNIITRDDEILQAISIGLTDAVENFGWSDFGGLPIKEIQEWLEKQGEQEPIEWKDSDEKYLFWALLSIQKDIAASEINGVNTKDLNDCVKWLYSLKQRIKGE